MALRVKESHSFDHQGVPITMRVGSLVAEDDPRVVGREMFYEPADTVAARTAPDIPGPIETATAGPGERRVRKVRESGFTASA